MIGLSPPSLGENRRSACEGKEGRSNGCLFLIAQVITKKASAVFIVVAVDAQIFPVRTIRGVILRVSIFVVDRQEVSVFIAELSCTFSTDESVNSEGLLSVIFSCRMNSLKFADQVIPRSTTAGLSGSPPSVDSVASVSHAPLPGAPFPLAGIFSGVISGVS